MSIFNETDLKYSYNWNPSKKEIVSKKIQFHDTYELNVDDGYEVLHYINSYMRLKNYAMLCTFQKIEKAIKEELPKTKTGHCKIKRWLSENYFF